MYPNAKFGIIKYTGKNWSHGANFVIIPNSENHTIMISASPHELESVNIQWLSDNKIKELWHYKFENSSYPINMIMRQVILFF